MKKSLWFVLFLSACAHKQVVPPVVLSPDVFWQDQDVRAKQVAKVSGKISLHYENDTESLSGRGRAISDINGQLRLELRDAFGRLHYDAALSGKDFTALYPRQKICSIDGNSGESYLGEVVGIHLSFADLQDLWVGLLPKGIVRGAITEWEWNAENESYEGKLKNAAGHVVMIGVDAQTKALKRVQYNLKDQSVVISYSDYEDCCEGGVKDSKVALAHVVAIELQKGKNQSIEVEWEDIKGLKETLAEQFKIKIPDDVRKIVMR